MPLSTTPAQVVSRLSAVPSGTGQAGLSEEGLGSLVTELVELAHSIAAKEEAFEDCLRRVRANTHKHELANLRDQIRAAQEAGRESDVHRLLAEYQRHLSVLPAVSPGAGAAPAVGGGTDPSMTASTVEATNP